MLTKDEWKERIETALPRSMQEVREKITNEPHLQRWIREASYEAAMGIDDPSDVQAESQAYGLMLDGLHDTFAPLAEAVDELTEGCGHLDINWRPLSPEFTTVYVDFGRDYDVHLFCRLKAISPDEARRVLGAVEEALPPSEPFPRRPNEATALAALDGRCLGVRIVRRHPSDDKPERTVTVLPPGQKAEKNIPLSDAPARVVEHLVPDDPTVSPDEWVHQ